MIELKYFLLFSILITIKAGVIPNNSDPLQSRRILLGHEVGDTRSYMVYLRPAPSEVPKVPDTNWLCGGVIIHERYILTSAACIEDVKHFYVVSGTNKWIPLSDTDNECIKNGAKKAVWKCVPKNYYFDGNEFNNIRWMSNDLAVVKVEDDFNFERRVKGCDYVPKKIAFNNRSIDLERSGQVASIAGWGSTDSFGAMMVPGSQNSPELLETNVVIISKKNCKKRWHPRYHNIIDEDMICAKDGMDTDAMSALCSEQGTNCVDLAYSEEDNEDTRRMVVNPRDLKVHVARHNETRKSMLASGGFCENDHGGPLVVGHGTSAVVIGVIAACQVRDVSGKCFGPFLYSSVWKNRHVLSCAIDKEMGATCRRLLRSTKTQISMTAFDWNSHPDGLPKSDGINRDMPSVFRTMLLKSKGI